MATTKSIRNKLKGMEEKELKKKLTALGESLRVIRFKAEGAKSKNVKESSVLKKQIARIMTELNQTKIAK
jgi:ribosomal protein L29